MDFFFIPGVDVDNYISFYGMRAHDVLMGVLVSEEEVICDELFILF